jgi:hypothetical protein
MELGTAEFRSGKNTVVEVLPRNKKLAPPI